MKKPKLWVGLAVAGVALGLLISVLNRDSVSRLADVGSEHRLAKSGSEGTEGAAAHTGAVPSPGADVAPSSSKFANLMASPGSGGEQAKLTLASMTVGETDRYLIKNSTLSIEAKDVRGASRRAKDAARICRGYISNEHETTDGLGQLTETLEVRVPADQFDATVERLQSLGRILDNQVTSEDVTEQFVDTDARLHNMKTTEGRLLEHLGHTGKLHDTLEIETELSRVREGVDELEGKLRFMAHKISYSTITLTFKEPAHAQPITPTESFSMGQVASEAMRSFVGFMQTVASWGIWAGVWSLIWAPILIVSRVIYVRWRSTPN